MSRNRIRDGMERFIESNPADLEPPILVISPHFDDAVLSCGSFLSAHPGAIVLTIMGGSPNSWTTWRQWDNGDCELPEGTDVVTLRKKEDLAALGALKCEHRWGNVLDLQYSSHLDADRPRQIRDQIEHALDECAPSSCLIPVGILHPDHEQVRRISLLVAQRDTANRMWFAYDDLPYRPRQKVRYQEALGEIRQMWSMAPVALRVDHDGTKKPNAVNHYQSQLRALTEGSKHLADDLDPEGYWALKWVGSD